MKGNDIVDEILAKCGRPRSRSGSDLLDAVADIPHDRHDTVGAIYLAERALSEIGPDDPAEETLKKVVSFKRRDKRYDKHDMKGILFVCEQYGASQADPAPSP